MGYASDAQRKAVHASKADGGKGNPNKMLSPTNFNRAMFGSMGANPSINALTNANAMAAQQMPQMPQMPQQPPVTPAVGVYGRPDMRAQLMGVGSNLSPMMKHADEEVKSLNAEIMRIRKQYENEEKEGDFYEDPDYEKARARLAAIEEEHKNK
jgi:hypothetical protein|tara:strand:+ start:190 stop:651 length:462 start_codon:yes stop_codon:yes gene_type:complete